MKQLVHRLHLGRQALAGRWQALPPLARGGLPVLLLALAVTLAAWLATENARLARRLVVADGEQQQVQADLAEIGRLRALPVVASAGGRPLAEALAASLRAQALTLTASAAEGGQVRVQGEAGFDAFVAWLGMAQQSHRLSVVALDVARRDGVARIDVLLAPATAP